ncbi:hypothetical protein PS6_003007 [Mucor atramentarius]
MKVSVAPLMMRIVTTRGGDKPNHWVTIKLKRSIKLKWPTDKLYWKAVSDDSQSNIAQKVIFYCLGKEEFTQIIEESKDAKKTLTD